MNYYRKIFASIFATSFGISVLLLWFMLNSIRNDASTQFVERYEKLADLVGQSLLEAESAAEKIGFNAAMHLSTLVDQGKIPSEDELRRLGKELDISLFAVINKDGKFLRDTVTGAVNQSHKLFDFCADYRKLIAGGTDLEVTPIIPSFPYRGPFKFIMIPSRDRKLILESGVNLANIAQILGNTMSTDRNIRSLGLFSPTFFNFGTIYSDGRFVDGDQTQAPLPLAAGDHELRRENLEVIRKVKISKPACCECKIKGVKGEGDYYYLIRLEASTAPLLQLINRAWWTAVAIGFFLFLFSTLVAHYLARRLVARLKKVDDAVREMNEAGELSKPLNVGGEDEVTSLAANFNQMAQSLVRIRGEQIALEKASALGEMARQVAHDIRSPLSALNTAVGSLESLPEERRQLVRAATQRINDIANSLLGHGRKPSASQDPEVVELLSSLDMLVSEKRLQLRKRPEIEIVPELSRAFGLFARLDGAELGRAVSNLVNNAAEAIVGKGKVAVEVFPKEGKAIVEIRDNGPGIPPELLSRLAEKGVSHGKEGGSGLGLYGARQLAESVGGRLEIESEIGKGTVARLVLPLAPAPSWFPGEVRVPKGGTVVSLDDDPSIHLLWEERLKELRSQCRHVVMRSPAELKAWLDENKTEKARAIFLVDHEMPGEFGAGLIARLGLAAQSILVTSRCQELAKQGVAEQLHLRMLSKQNAAYVPFVLEE